MRVNANPRFAQADDDALAQSERDPRQRHRHHDCQVDGEPFGRRSGLARENHHRGDGARTGEHRHGERREGDVGLGAPLADLGRALLCAPFAVQHAHRHDPENHGDGIHDEQDRRQREQRKVVHRPSRRSSDGDPAGRERDDSDDRTDHRDRAENQLRRRERAHSSATGAGH